MPGPNFVVSWVLVIPVDALSASAARASAGIISTHRLLDTKAIFLLLTFQLKNTTLNVYFCTVLLYSSQPKLSIKSNIV